MTNKPNSKQYDLEERTLEFAKNTRMFTKKLPRNIQNTQDVTQLTRSSGSIGANYIEANESLSKKDFFHRIKISRKEAKETIYWLNLIDTQDKTMLNNKRDELINEATQLMKIFGAILSRKK